MNVSKLLPVRLAAILLAVSMTATAPLLAQGRIAPDGEVFLKALRENAGGKALNLIQSNGASIVNHRGVDGSTPLHIVVQTRNDYWLSFLLEKGADKNAAN